MASFVTLSDYLAWAGLDQGAVNLDALEESVENGNQQVIDFLEWDPTPQEYTELLDGTGGNVIVPSTPYITAVSAITINGQPAPFTWTIDKFGIFAAVPAAGSGTSGFEALGCGAPIFPYGTRNISVTYTAGLDPMPASIPRAVRIAIQASYDAVTADHNATGDNFPGINSRAYRPDGPGSLPPAAKSAIMRYKRVAC